MEIKFTKCESDLDCGVLDFTNKFPKKLHGGTNPLQVTENQPQMLVYHNYGPKMFILIMLGVDTNITYNISVCCRV